VLALFTGLAFAQQENCSAQATNSTPLRYEGLTEQTGDIIINCVGGQAIANGLNVPLVNITVFYNTQVTSRLLGTANAAGQTPSEALLLIDEPNTNPLGLPVGTTINTVSYGQTQNLSPCLTPFTGCIQTAGPSVNGFATVAAPAYNVYQGVVSGSSVTFYGIPVLPPTTVGSRVYRITNVRVNANVGGAASGTTPVQSYITVSGSAALPISNSQPIVGYIQQGLTASVSGAQTYNQCQTKTKAAAGTLKFQELFGTAFKTRVYAQSNTLYAGQTPPAADAISVGGTSQANLNQSTPGGIYNSESNFIYKGAFSANNYTVGLSDFGTRLKATFNNIPSGVHIFVGVTNAATPQNGAPVGGSAGNTSATSPYVGYAALVSGETTSDGAGTPPLLSATDNVAPLGIAEVIIDSGSKSGTAVWEVLNTNPNTSEAFAFPVYISYTAATATNAPLPGTSTVTLSYAPTPPAFSATAGGVASGSLTIPRFVVNPAGSGNVFTINVCRTILLYPYVTNQQGFDTGLTVANTSQDPMLWGTGAQKGKCVFTFYGGTTAAPTVPPGPYDTSVEAAYVNGIPGGQVWANTVGAIAPTFQGYAFAICNFQFAHGFAFISDVGARNLAMGYLALIIPDVGFRDPSPFGENVAGSGEQEAH
jgi:hypothetical protein